jgi:hypothetical protein
LSLVSLLEKRWLPFVVCAAPDGSGDVADFSAKFGHVDSRLREKQYHVSSVAQFTVLPSKVGQFYFVCSHAVECYRLQLAVKPNVVISGFRHVSLTVHPEPYISGTHTVCRRGLVVRTKKLLISLLKVLKITQNQLHIKALQK